MKICFWVASVRPVGGVSRVLCHVADQLAKEHEVTIVSSNDKAEEETPPAYPIHHPVRFLSGSQMKRKTPLGFRIWRKARRTFHSLPFSSYRWQVWDEPLSLAGRKNWCAFFDSLRQDVIVGVQGQESLWLAMIAPHLSARCIGWQHSSFEAYFRNPGRYLWKLDSYYRRYLPRLDAYVVLNELDKEKVDRAFSISSTVIYNPKSFVTEQKADPARKRFLAAGRLVHAKGFDIFLEAFALFRQKNKEWDCVVAGDGEEKERLQEQLCRLHLEDCVHLVGVQKDMLSCYLDASVFLLPSRWEGMPLVALEAQEAGLGIITFDRPFLRPFLEDGREGLIARGDDASSFAQAMLRVASDEKLRRRMQEKALERSKLFTDTCIMKQWEMLLSEK